LGTGASVGSTWITLLLIGLVVAVLLLIALVAVLRYRAAVRRDKRRPTVSVAGFPPVDNQNERTAAGRSSSSDTSPASQAYWTQGLRHRHSRLERLLHRRHHGRAA
jgi:hypothetical protein